MRNNILERKYFFIYLLCDLVTAAAAWSVFFYFRKTVVEEQEFIPNTRFYVGLCCIPVFWAVVYFISGAYNDLLHRHRLKEVGQMMLVTLLGVLVLFFLFILDDKVRSYKNYYFLSGILFALHLSFTLIPRFILTSGIVRKVHKRKISFATLIVGGNARAYQIFQE